MAATPCTLPFVLVLFLFGVLLFQERDPPNSFVAECTYVSPKQSISNRNVDKKQDTFTWKPIHFAFSVIIGGLFHPLRLEIIDHHVGHIDWCESLVTWADKNNHSKKNIVIVIVTTIILAFSRWGRPGDISYQVGKTFPWSIPIGIACLPNPQGSPVYPTDILANMAMLRSRGCCGRCILFRRQGFGGND